MNFKLLPLIGFIGGFIQPAFAAENTTDTLHTTTQTTPILFAGLTYGGDDLYQVEYVDGSDTELKAGGMLSLGGGMSFNLNSYTLQTTAAYHFDSATAKNGDVSFSRWVFEVLPFYNIDEHHRVGLGLGYHTGIELESDFDIDKTQVEFDATTGIIAEYGYSWARNTLALRYVSVKYDISELDGMNVSSANESVSGSHLGAYYYFHF
ncbi:hypothetical protein [Catenovulum adriaticum]|uniref:Outer membrane protein beta-barrel domain-containing protein n=1 Tax=Catenovulum adriaticum TaxID=2984846 RepID=A0ABY7ANS8_9ALTE|nr:hypothetical protein [Catenovulum sp. TS8]WAJ70090.1 hypothetical protein OLW01_13240 [Catenovulum sp. TS8]